MNRADELRLTAIALGIPSGGVGWNEEKRRRRLQELGEFYCSMSDEDKWIVWNIAKLFATWPKQVSETALANRVGG